MRASDQSLTRRPLGFACTIALHGAVLAAFVLEWTPSAKLVAAPLSPIAVTLLPPASPAEPQELPPGPQQVEAEAGEMHPDPPLVKLESPVPALTLPEPSTSSSASPAAAETSAPESIPAPPASLASTLTEKTWEAELLAHLEMHRRYPAKARLARLQGTVLLSFRMDHTGNVTRAKILRSSGHSILDTAALETLRRAIPLPKPPEDKPAEIDIAVPVEFFVR